MSNINGIVYPPTLDFHYLVQRPQQIMKGFSELQIPSYYHNVPSPTSNTARGIEKINPYLYVFNHVDPQPFLQQIKPVAYFSATWHIDLVYKYDPSLVVFDSVDEPCDEFKDWQPFYRKAASLSDVVLTTADKLYEAARAINPHTYLIPNGCDYEFFSQAHERKLNIPTDMRGIDRPIIGYIGVIATWLDLELIDRLAWRYPHYNLVMIGPLYNVEQVPKRPNIHWLGFKEYATLPAYAQMFDVGIIPFKNTKMVEAVNPIKMWEYMATGMPIVTTAMPETRKYKDLLWYSDDSEEFIVNVQQALEERSLEKRYRRMQIASRNSWSSRSRQIVHILENRLEEKQQAGFVPPVLKTLPELDQLLNQARSWGSEPLQSNLALQNRLKVINRPSVTIPPQWEAAANVLPVQPALVSGLTVKGGRSYKVKAV